MSSTKLTRKPYPWRCSNCRESAVYAGVIDYHVDLDYSGQTYHIKLDGLKTPRCRKCGTPLLDGDANAKITRELLRKAKLLTPRQIAKYRESLELTQSDLAAALGVAEDIVAYWEDGMLIQTRPHDNMLRLFFGLPEARDLLTKQKLTKVGLVMHGNQPRKKGHVLASA
ncbi:MAG: type II toxin-antitoxin system MqsA family antitoxin [Planctomycetes bacterium]|nr:type II toxin-antitoxin system MqsA family antitoxin [Planctomycetota bacterium]